MSMPLYPQPPPDIVTEQSHNGGSEHDSVGPVVGVLVVIIVLGVIAVMIGRLCSGKRIMGYGQYDLESWAESKCSSCIDGRIIIPSPPRAGECSSSVPATPLQNHHQETKQGEQSSQNSPADV
ncbi:hypothetical protein L6164_024693 [Bauhinia variegata]|uniref:Uncharacterized protein n=1 Tax=Bauhinia variegata TaxID=167791 RepID=A0ACB9M1B2_BAUVA|nr:hypothetical protein L6164_024693 [Bauhinia variegata]